MAKTIQERLEEARRARQAAEGKLSDADKAEIAAREEIDRELAAARDADERERALNLARRLDAAREALGDVPLRALQVPGASHSFVLKAPPAAAYNAWENGVTASVMAGVGAGGKVDRANVARVFAAAAVYDWNGLTDFGPQATNGHALLEFFKAHPAVASDVVNVAVELSKAAAEARKSPH